MSALRVALGEATDGKGGVLVLVGEPGLGKTRLVQECRKLFMSWVGSTKGRLPLWFEGRAGLVCINASLRPLPSAALRLGGRGAGRERESQHERRLERAISAVYGAKADRTRSGCWRMFWALGLRAQALFSPGSAPNSSNGPAFPPFATSSPGLMDYGPTLLALEDLHWADPTSLRVTESISSLTDEGPLLLVLTRRPEPDPGTSRLEATLLEDAVAAAPQTRARPSSWGA